VKRPTVTEYALIIAIVFAAVGIAAHMLAGTHL
jgi:hypothetical protein